MAGTSIEGTQRPKGTPRNRTELEAFAELRPQPAGPRTIIAPHGLEPCIQPSEGRRQIHWWSIAPERIELSQSGFVVPTPDSTGGATEVLGSLFALRRVAPEGVSSLTQQT